MRNLKKLKSLKALGGRVLVYGLVLALVIEPPLLAVAASTPPSPPEAADNAVEAQTKDNQKLIQSFMAAVLRANNEADAPPSLTTQEANLWFMQTQKVYIRDPDGLKAVNPAKIQLEVSVPFVSDLESQLTMSVEPNGDFKMKHDKTSLRQLVQGINATDFAFDEQFVFVISQQGEVHAASVQFLKDLIFQSPIPFFKVAKLDEEVLQRRGGGRFKLQLIHRHSEPLRLSSEFTARMASRSSQKLYFTAGDLAVLNESGETIEVLSRTEMAEHAYLDGVLAGLLASVTDPQYFLAENFVRDILIQNQIDLEPLRQRLQDPRLQAALSKEETSNTFRDLSTKAVMEGVDHLQRLRFTLRRGPEREQLVLEEWIKDREVLRQEEIKRAELERAEAELNTFAKRFKKKLITHTTRIGKATARTLKKAVTPKTMKALAITMASLAGIAGFDALTHHQASHWAIAMACKFWNMVAPPILMSEKWKPLTISAVRNIWLTIPFIFTVARVASVFTKWTFQRTYMIAGLRLYGIVQASIYLMSIALRQKNFFPAIRAGMNPVEHPEMFNAPWAATEKIIEKRRKLESRLQRSRRVGAFAWLLAHANVMHSDKIDPLTMLALEFERTTHQSLDLDDARHRKEWAFIAAELNDVLEHQEEFDVASDLRSIPQEQLLKFVEQANQLHKDLHDSSRLRNQVDILRAKLKTHWHYGIPAGIGAFGYDSYKLLMSAMPTHTVAGQFYRKTTIDFLMSTLFTALVGDRANPRDTKQLVASDRDPLGINPKYKMDVADSILDNSVAVPAGTFLSYDEGARIQDYLPERNRALTSEKFGQTAKGFLKTLLNLPKLDIGGYFVINLQQSLMTILAGEVIGVLPRLIDQSFADAVPAQIWSICMAIFYYGFIWVVTDRSLTLYQQNVTDKSLELQDAQTRIEQAINRNDEEGTQRAVERMLMIYKRAKVLPPALAGNEGFQRAKALLESSRQTAPVADKPNEVFMSTVNFAAAFLAALRYSAFSVIAYGDNPHWYITAFKGVLTAIAGTTAIWGAQQGINHAWAKIETILKARRQQEQPQAPEEDGVGIAIQRKRSFSNWCADIFPKF